LLVAVQKLNVRLPVESSDDEPAQVTGEAVKAAPPSMWPAVALGPLAQLLILALPVESSSESVVPFDKWYTLLVYESHTAVGA
jgi:hypothetical protein